MQKKWVLPSAKFLRSLGLITLCSLGAFALGIETAGDVHPFTRSEAALEEIHQPLLAPVQGDANGNGILDPNDASIILQVAEGLEPSSPDLIRRGDTDGDLQLTTKDALRVLYELSNR